MGLVALSAILAAPVRGEIIDRVIAVVDTRAITQNEVERQLRLQAFTDGVNIDNSLAARKEALERLIQWTLIQQDALSTRLANVNETAIDDELRRRRTDRFVSREAFHDAVRSYGLEETDVREFIRRQLLFLAFVDNRFRAGLLIPRPEIEAYYKQVYVPRHEQTGQGAPLPLEDIADQIEKILVEQRLDPMIEDWLRQRRAGARIVILDESLGLGDNEDDPAATPDSPLIPLSLSRSAEAREAPDVTAESPQP